MEHFLGQMTKGMLDSLAGDLKWAVICTIVISMAALIHPKVEGGVKKVVALVDAALGGLFLVVTFFKAVASCWGGGPPPGLA